MKNIKTIFAREFAAYFNAPIAYIFIVVFLAVNSGLFMTSFFLSGTADMRGFFSLLPITLIVFIPAITMRLWSEDSKSGTIALLHSFPMSAMDLVLGKFFASFLFYLIALAGTLIIPIMIVFLGRPDIGPIIGGYFGSALLGAFYLAVGIFISGLFKDQIIAFILGMVACFVFYMVGTDYIAIVLDGWIGGLGTLLNGAIGTANHFASIERGVIDIRDIIYFLSYTILFLWLNSVTVEQIMRRLADKKFTINALVGLAVIFMLNLVIGSMHLGRFDLTSGGMYTVSPAAKNILRKLKDAPITVKFYVSPKDKMPAAMKTMEQDVTDILREFEMVSKRFKYEVVDPTTDVDMAKTLQNKGINPFDTRSVEKDAFNIKRIYSAIAISYLDKPEEVIPQVVPQNISNLEYEILSRIYRMTMPSKPKVVLVAPFSESNMDPRQRQMMMQMGRNMPEKEDHFKNVTQMLQSENYDVIRCELTEQDPLPPNFDMLIVISPENLSERAKYEINKAVISGKDVLIAAQNYKFSYMPQPGMGIQVMPQKQQHGLNTLLEKYGLGMSNNILMDESQEVLSIPVRQNIGGFLPMTVEQPVKLPMQIKVTDQGMNNRLSITSRLGSILYLWGSALSYDKSKLSQMGLESEVLLNSSAKSWEIAASGGMISGDDIDPRKQKIIGSQPLGVLVRGQFPDAYPNMAPPKWPGDTTMIQPSMPIIEKKPGKLVIIGCGEMFTDQVVGAFDNAMLMLNSVDALLLGDDLINVRSKMVSERYIKETSATAKMFWRFLVIILIPAILIVVGIMRYMMRRQRRETYQRLLEQTQ
jgi:ABC-type uncharacterized transport system involved in gliding motility auxiliary subunit